MLQRIRDSLQAQRWFGLIVLSAIALVFVAWGAYGIVDVGFGAGNYAAKVNGEKISLEDANEVWQRQQTQWQQAFGGEIPPERRRELQDAVLDALIRERLLTERSRELGYRVSDAQIDRAIAAEPAFQVEGKYSAELAKARLAQAGISIGAFETELRTALERGQLRQSLQVSSFVTPAEAARLLALEDQQREARYAVLPVEKFAGDAAVDEAAIRKYYEEHRSEFLTPESVRLQYAELRLDELAPQAIVSDAELREQYERQKEAYVEPERRRARHILLEVSDPKDDAAVRKKAQELLERARAGEDFAALAKRHSQDGGSAAQGGDLGWAERSFFAGPFSEALFAMSPGEIRGPVKTEFGYHVLKLEGVQPGRARSFEEARAEIEAQAREDRAADLFGERQEQLQMRLEESGSTDLETLSREFGLQLGVVEEFTREGGGAPLGASPDLRDTVFGTTVLGERRIGGPVPLGEDRLVLVKVLEHRKPAPRALETVREQIVAAIRKERGSAAAREAAAAALARLEAGESFEAVAKDLGVPAEPARFIARSDPSVPAQLREQIFESPKPAPGEPVHLAVQLDGGASVIATVTAVRDGTVENAALRAQRVQQLGARRGGGEVTAYVDELHRRADVDKNPKAFE